MRALCARRARCRPCCPEVTTLPRLLAKIRGNLRLLRADPEAFARNVSQVTHPSLFAERLLGLWSTAPLHVAAGDTEPALNILAPSWDAPGMTGGPNTTVNLAARIARLGVPVRLVSAQAPVSLDPAWLAAHAGALAGGPFPAIALASAADPARPLRIGARDLFMATHWSTAEQLRAVLPGQRSQRFFYMLQEFEPAFYPWSSDFARVTATFDLPFWPVVNQSLLAEYLFAQPYGRLADPALRADAIVFEPAVDATVFHPGPVPQAKTLLFYARPTNPRNLFGLGVLALREAAKNPALAGWSFRAIGGRGGVPTLRLGGDAVLHPAAWRGYAGYADLLRSADVLLCPMLSPHTSYPVLEMAACGGLSVTTAFATKTDAALHALSLNIVPAPPTIDGLAKAVIAAVRASQTRSRSAPLNAPRDWSATLDPVARQIAAEFRASVA